MTLEQLVTQLRAAYGDGLRAVILYGSAVAGEHVKKRSDYNVLIVADTLPFAQIKATAAIMRAWQNDNNPPPLIFTVREWQHSSDIFAMEYADILARHRVLHGDESVFDGIVVDRDALRLQLEREAVGKLLRLRQGVFLSGDDKREKLNLLAASLSTLMVIFRGVMRLTGDEPPTNYSELVHAIAARTQIDPAPYDEVVLHVRGERAIPKERAGEVLAGYLQGMETVATYINSLPMTRTNV